MAAPFKRVCQQAVKQNSSICRRTTPNVAQWRPFSTTNPRRAAAAVSTTSQDTIAAVDPDFETEELSAIAHQELDQHRELRTLLRTAAWEMPLLSALAQPYTPPNRTAQPLRWRYTTYMGEMHPAAKKVVVEFRPSDLKLSEAQNLKLLKLLGPRYNVDKDMVRMSCENFETPAMNKRQLADTIQALIAEAKNGKSDSFDDLPLDTRYRKPKLQLKFPDEWLLTEERKQELDEARSKKLLDESKRVEDNQIVNGVQAIEDARRLAAQQAKLKPSPAQAEAKTGFPAARKAAGGRAAPSRGRR